MAEPGVLHPVDQAFYDLTIKQRDKAWRELEEIRKVAVEGLAELPGQMAHKSYLERILKLVGGNDG